MVLRDAKVYKNDALSLIQGRPAIHPFSKKLGLCPNHPCPEIEKIYKAFIVEKDIDARPKCIFYSTSYISAKKFYYEEALPNKKRLSKFMPVRVYAPGISGIF